jgi:hypothetical protein
MCLPLDLSLKKGNLLGFYFKIFKERKKKEGKKERNKIYLYDFLPRLNIRGVSTSLSTFSVI